MVAIVTADIVLRNTQDGRVRIYSISTAGQVHPPITAPTMPLNWTIVGVGKFAGNTTSSILWRDTSKAEEAATSMKITAQDLARFGIIDQIVTEPIGGAHRDPQAAIAATAEAITKAFEELKGLDRETVKRQRREKFLAIGRALG